MSRTNSGINRATVIACVALLHGNALTETVM